MSATQVMRQRALRLDFGAANMRLRQLLQRAFLVLAICPTLDSLADTTANAEIIKLLKAGFGEPVVIQAIDARQGTFDTSSDALITLKQNGASDAVIQRVLVKGSQKGSATGQGLPPAGAECVFDGSETQMAILADGKQAFVRRARSRPEVDAGASTVANAIVSTFTLGFVPSKADVMLVVDGEHSGTRISGRELVITSVGILVDQIPEDYFALVKMISHDQKRYVYIGSGSTGIRGDRSEYKIPPDVIVPIEITTKQKSCTYTAQGGKTYKLNMYSLRPKAPLPPGEYAFVMPSMQSVYDFGVDK